MIQVGDIYEHEMYGRGQVINIYEGYATIAFDGGQRYQYDVRTLMEAEEMDEGLLNVASGLARAGARIGGAAKRGAVQAAGKTFGAAKKAVSKAVEAPLNAARKAKAIVGQEIASSNKRTRLNTAASQAHAARKAAARDAYRAAVKDSGNKLNTARTRIGALTEELNQAILEYEYLKSEMED